MLEKMLEKMVKFVGSSPHVSIFQIMLGVVTFVFEHLISITAISLNLNTQNDRFNIIFLKICFSKNVF